MEQSSPGVRACRFQDSETFIRKFEKKDSASAVKMYNEVKRSGTSHEKVLKAKQALDEYSFLSWLEPFVQLCAKVSNVPNASRDRELEQEDEDESSDSSKDDGRF